MKCFLQAATLFWALALGQSLSAQDIHKEKDPFYMPRFSREKAAQYIPYQDYRNSGNRFLNQSLNYQPTKANPNPLISDGKELETLLKKAPVVKTLYGIATADKEPLQIFHGKVSLNVFSSGKNYSSGRAFYYPGNPLNSLYGPLPGTSFNFQRKRTSAGNSVIRWFGKKLAAKRMRK